MQIRSAFYAEKAQPTNRPWLEGKRGKRQRHNSNFRCDIRLVRLASKVEDRAVIKRHRVTGTRPRVAQSEELQLPAVHAVIETASSPGPLPEACAGAARTPPSKGLTLSNQWT